MPDKRISSCWVYTDALILMSIRMGCGSKGGGLPRIMGATDYIDRSYPTLEQLNDALNRLNAARLIYCRRGKFSVSPQAEELFAKAASVGRRALRSRLHNLERILDCPICGVQLKKVRRRFDFAEAELKQAIQDYLKKH